MIKDIAYGLRETFNGRNNDVNGYWGLGVLYRHADNHRTDEVTLDLLSCSVMPYDGSLTEMAHYYGLYMQKRADRFELPKDWITSAIIKVKFKSNEWSRSFRSRLGDPYIVEVIISAKTGFVYTSTTGGYCWPHDPKRESRRWMPDRKLSIWQKILRVGNLL